MTKQPTTPSAEDGDARAIEQALLAPFEPGEVKFKPQTVSGNRALALAYIDARVVMDRLDSVFGVLGWQDTYQFLPDGSAICELSVRRGTEWITKTDVGGQSEQSDEGDRRKAACSDALKRAAVKFGIGRYLYRLPVQWCDYDPQKRRFARPPALPDWALPRGVGMAAAPGLAPPRPTSGPGPLEDLRGQVQQLMARVGKPDHWYATRLGQKFGHGDWLRLEGVQLAEWIGFLERVLDARNNQDVGPAVSLAAKGAET